MSSRSSISYCKVSYCRFSWSHVTKGHVCGVCNNYGHGELECNSPEQTNMLMRCYHNDTLPEPKQCTISDCEYKEYHTTSAHHCKKCNQRAAHTLANCGDIEKTVKCPMCRADNVIKTPTKIFGLTDQCVICCDKNVEVLFLQCNHCCICSECFQKL
jgi:hypothetical protein